ncbi:MAG: phospho-N-acetylmuramoyl-pentapeptide-transferase [Planctomycetaceae bacterium]|nr:phospho-N-acetylmuramoyl-pentapeptide-transferase [Planctomycetaceae bacterium]
MLSELKAASLAAACSAGVLSLILSLVCGPTMIHWLGKRATERIASDSLRLNELHAGKKNTPTMGGLLIAGASLVSIVCFSDRSSPLVWIYCLTLMTLTGLGAADDWIKLRTTKKGLSARQKLSVQCVIAGTIAVALFLTQPAISSAGDIGIPGTSWIFSAGWGWVPWAAFIIVATSNAVNLTDGLDGLASGCMAIASLTMATIICGSSVIEADAGSRAASAVSFAALTGSTLGFLWWNRHPAKIFMGDAGSLPLGGLFAVSALATRCELLLIITGAVFVVETLSVIVQVGWYRRTRTRILLCSPLHNHFVFQGVPERKIVFAFWLAAMIAAVAGLVASFW